jgi:hypothetical protein
MQQEWIIELREEIRQMIRQAIDASPYGFIVALERDEQQDAPEAFGADSEWNA